MAQSVFQAFVLAAGKSSRFKTDTTKLAYTICGQEMIMYPLSMLTNLKIPTALIVGYQKEVLQKITEKHKLSHIPCIHQEQQLGTGHAVAITQSHWNAQNIIIMNGDMPLLKQETIEALLQKHVTTAATITFLTSHNVDPTITGYGRVINEKKHISIVEARDFTGDPTSNCCINAGVYIFKREFLQQYVTKLTPHNNAQELYITDLIALASKQGLIVETVSAPFDEIRGINTLKELWAAEHIKRSELITTWMERGVHFTAAQTTHIDLNVTIGANTTIGAGVHLKNGTHIGEYCNIDAYSIIENSTLAPHATIKPHSIIKDSYIQGYAQIGPFAHIRNKSIVGEQTIIGNFVELSDSTIGTKTKIKHLSYIGNAKIGSHVNIGAGTIVCNYNGVTKNTTIIEDHAFIGSNNSLVAPVTIAERAITAAGSTITDNVPADALAIARTRQVNKDGYARHIRNPIPFVAATKTNKSSLHDES